MSEALREKILTLDEAAEYLRLPVATLYAWRAKGTGPRASRVGRYVRYRLRDIEKWLDEQAVA